MGANFSIAKPNVTFTQQSHPADVARPLPTQVPVAVQVAKAVQTTQVPVAIQVPKATQISGTQAVPLASQAVPLASQAVPLASQAVPLASQAVPLASQGQTSQVPDPAAGLFADGVNNAGNVVPRPAVNIAFPNFGNNPTLVLDVENGSKEEGANVILWPRNNGKNQSLIIMIDDAAEQQARQRGFSYFYLKFEHSGKFLSIDQNGKLIQSSVPRKFAAAFTGYGIYLMDEQNPESKVAVGQGKGKSLTTQPAPNPRTGEKGIPNGSITFLEAKTGNQYLQQVAQTCMDNWGSITLAGATLVAVGFAGYYMGKRANK